eukprot:9500850-Pyramimonas_sp.AAC.1
MAPEAPRMFQEGPKMARMRTQPHTHLHMHAQAHTRTHACRPRATLDQTNQSSICTRSTLCAKPCARTQARDILKMEMFRSVAESAEYSEMAVLGL